MRGSFEQENTVSTEIVIMFIDRDNQESTEINKGVTRGSV